MVSGGIDERGGTTYARAVLGAALGAIGTAQGRAIANHGNHEELRGTFRVGVNVTNPPDDFNDQDAFDQSHIDGIIDHLDPFELAGRIGTLDTQTAAIDARIARGSRVGEGGGSRLKVDLPFSYTRINGTVACNRQLAIGVEMPAGQNFSIEPGIGYGATGSAESGQVGHIAQGSIAARYVLAGRGRGRLVLGAMGGYSPTLGTPFTDLDLDPGLKNGVFRGRSPSVRRGYSYTQYSGDDLYNNSFHEFTPSVGLRTREEQVRGLGDVVRLHRSTIRASSCGQYTVGRGFRF